MKTYTILKGGRVEPWIALALDDQGSMSVGEVGRARRRTTVAVPEGSEMGIDGLNRPVVVGVPAGRQPDTSALVCLRDQSGFRGGWRLESGPGILVVAEGRCAQGEAGRMGGGAEYLLVLADGASITIRRSGRLYGGAADIVVVNRAGAVRTDRTT